MGPTPSKIGTTCEMCLEDRAEAFCQQCTKFICDRCVRAHTRLKTIFSGHYISTLEELKKLKAEEVLNDACKVHNQPINVYCYSCNILTCHDCTITEHYNHRYEFFRKAAPETRKILLKQLDPIFDAQANRSNAIKKIQFTISELEELGESTQSEIKKWGSKMRAVIDKHQQELIAEAALKFQHKVKRLSDQENDVYTVYTYAQSVIDYTKQCLDHSSDGDIMCMHVELQNRINKEIQDQQVEEENLEPAEEVDIGIEMNSVEELKQFCFTKAKITQFPFECVISGRGFKFAEVNTMSEFRVMIQLSNGRPIRRQVVIDCRLKSLASNYVTNCTVRPVKVSEYRIQYTPTVRGHHELIVTVNGQEEADSSFPVFVSIYPTQLGKPVQIITGLKEPLFPAITSTGIVVTEMKNIAVLNIDKSGTKLHYLQGSKYNFNDLEDVSVDSTDGGIYITCYSPSVSKIIKLTSNYDMKQVFTAPPQRSDASG